MHHACLLLGESDSLLKKLVDFLEDETSFRSRGNPDFFQISLDVCGIDEARMLKDRALMRPIGDIKIVIVSFNSITTEAQNSLLKIFEEPLGQTHFFVIAPNKEIFLDTLLSRFFVVDGELDGSTDRSKMDSVAESFLKSSPKDRISQVASMIEKKDKTEVVRFLNSLEGLISKSLKKDGPSESLVNISEEILRSKSFLYDRSPSLKMILEHLSCIIPISNKSK